MSKGRILFAVFAMLSVSAAAQELSDYRKLLLPAFASQQIRGLHGSTFATLLRGYAEVDVTYFGRIAEGQTTPSFHTQPAFHPIWSPLNYGPAVPSGRFLFLQRDKELALQYSLQSSDANGETADQMTALPIVEEPLTGRSWILGIPILPLLSEELWPVLRGYRYRNMLRVYDWEGDGRGEVDVTLFVEGAFGRSGGGTPQRLGLNRRDGNDPTFAWYAEMPLDRCYPFSAHTPCVAVSVRVEIEPVTPNLQHWAFVSTTDNRTQQVTIFEPQPRRR